MGDKADGSRQMACDERRSKFPAVMLESTLLWHSVRYWPGQATVASRLDILLITAIVALVSFCCLSNPHCTEFPGRRGTVLTCGQTGFGKRHAASLGA